MEKLHFKTSSGIKNILGRDLITDRFVAIFELVKNSYDANATRVDVIFSNNDSENKIIIKDNGIGMDRNDLINKWLFIAYSEKKEGHENKSDRAFVGSKGIGRLSCDSLGEYLVIRTKKKNSLEIHELRVNWNDFEESLERRIEDVNVSYLSEESSVHESSFTELIISGLRHSWNNESDIQKTKRKLERLKNPFVSDNNFNIYCKRSFSELDSDSIIKNNISEILEGKTISIKATIDDLIVIELYDRGNIIYKISKENDVFPRAKLSIVVHYLNTSAKNQFKRKMGVEAVNYGNIFIYKNGFRVNPYGEKEEDLFGINVRKAQGYNRNLGTREIIGYISIKDTHNLFKESSSRDNGFIHNFYFNQLQDFYKKQIHFPLEKYILFVKWGEVSDTGEGIYFDDQSSNEIQKFKKSLARANKNFSIDYFYENISIDEITPEKQLLKISNSLPDENKKIINDVARRITEIKVDNAQKEEVIKRKSEEIRVVEQRNKNLMQSRPDTSYGEQVAHHFIKMAEALKYSVKSLASFKEVFPDDKLESYIKTINKIKKTEMELTLFRELLLKTQYDMRSAQNINLYNMSKWYFSEKNVSDDFKVICQIVDGALENSWDVECKILDFVMLLENFYNNAREHGASYIEFLFYNENITVTSNSNPIADYLIDKVFDIGISTKDNGTGIGLYQIRQFCKKNKLKITAENNNGCVVFNIKKDNIS